MAVLLDDTQPLLYYQVIILLEYIGKFDLNLLQHYIPKYTDLLLLANL